MSHLWTMICNWWNTHFLLLAWIVPEITKTTVILIPAKRLYSNRKLTETLTVSITTRDLLLVGWSNVQPSSFFFDDLYFFNFPMAIDTFTHWMKNSWGNTFKFQNLTKDRINIRIFEMMNQFRMYNLNCY